MSLPECDKNTPNDCLHRAIDKIEGFRRYDTAKQQHKRLPDLRPAMNKLLKKELKE